MHAIKATAHSVGGNFSSVRRGDSQERVGVSRYLSLSLAIGTVIYWSSNSEPTAKVINKGEIKNINRLQAQTRGTNYHSLSV